jgi:hypothetical protein
MSKLPKVKFLGEECTVHLEAYMRGGHALQLKCEDGSPMAMATTWVEGLGPQELAIKDYSENEGVYDLLLEAGVIEPYHRTINSGFVELKVTTLATK